MSAVKKFGAKKLRTRIWAMPNVMAAPLNTAEWCPLFSAAKFGWCPLPEWHAVTLPRCESRWNLLGCPKLPNQSQPLVGRSSPYCGDMWTTYCCLTSFFPIVDTCLSCEDSARWSCVMVPRWWSLHHFCVLYYQRASCSRFQSCILNSH